MPIQYIISGWKTVVSETRQWIYETIEKGNSQNSFYPTKRLSVMKRGNRGWIFGSGNTSLAACWRTGSRRGPRCAHPQSVPHGSALPSVEPLRQSVAFFPFAWVFFYGGGRWTVKKYITISSSLFENLRTLVINSSFMWPETELKLVGPAL
jgi:hypothetical protein